MLKADHESRIGNDRFEGKFKIINFISIPKTEIGIFIA